MPTRYCLILKREESTISKVKRVYSSMHNERDMEAAKAVRALEISVISSLTLMTSSEVASKVVGNDSTSNISSNRSKYLSTLSRVMCSSLTWVLSSSFTDDRRSGFSTL